MISTNEDDFQVCAQGMHLLSQEGDGSVRKIGPLGSNSSENDVFASLSERATKEKSYGESAVLQGSTPPETPIGSPWFRLVWTAHWQGSG
jgi:hypothetical protein